MDSTKMLYFAAFLVVASYINGARGYTMVTGTVFCDPCKDGIFEYPVRGINVTMECLDSNGKFTEWRKETTTWLGNYVMRFDGAPDLRGCQAQVSSEEPSSNGCSTAAGPASTLQLTFDILDMTMYRVDPLLAQPTKPMSFCPTTSTTPPSPFPQQAPAPIFEASACSHREWKMPQHRCYWKVVRPETRVSLVFGLIAARRFGMEMTVWQALNGRGDPYATLLREGTTALLNSYNSNQFQYQHLEVIHYMNLALLGSTRQILHTALGFIRANTGIGSNSTCKFSDCN